MRIGYVPRGAHLLIFVKSFDPKDKSSVVTTRNEGEAMVMTEAFAKKWASKLGMQAIPIT